MGARSLVPTPPQKRVYPFNKKGQFHLPLPHGRASIGPEFEHLFCAKCKCA